MSTIVLDTDFLIKISNDPLPSLDLREIARQYTLSTIPQVMTELEGLTHHKEKKTARRARNAFNVLKDNQSPTNIKIEILKEPRAQEGGEADLELMELARKSNLTIATLDHSLLSKLDIEGLNYLTLRNDRPLLKEQRI